MFLVHRPGRCDEKELLEFYNEFQRSVIMSTYSHSTITANTTRSRRPSWPVRNWMIFTFDWQHCKSEMRMQHLQKLMEPLGEPGIQIFLYMFWCLFSGARYIIYYIIYVIQYMLYITLYISYTVVYIITYIMYYRLYGMCYMLYVVCCMLDVICSMLYIICYVLCAMCYVLCVMCYMLYVICYCYMLYIIQYI